MTALFWERVVARLKTFQIIQDDYSLDSTLVHGLRPDRLQNVITKSSFAFL